MDRGAWRAVVHGSKRVGHDWVTQHTWIYRIKNIQDLKKEKTPTALSHTQRRSGRTAKLQGTVLESVALRSHEWTLPVPPGDPLAGLDSPMMLLQMNPDPALGELQAESRQALSRLPQGGQQSWARPGGGICHPVCLLTPQESRGGGYVRIGDGESGLCPWGIPAHSQLGRPHRGQEGPPRLARWWEWDWAFHGAEEGYAEGNFCWFMFPLPGRHKELTLPLVPSPLPWGGGKDQITLVTNLW